LEFISREQEEKDDDDDDGNDDNWEKEGQRKSRMATFQDRAQHTIAQLDKEVCRLNGSPFQSASSLNY
jgi:hypothetical protein